MKLIFSFLFIFSSVSFAVERQVYICKPVDAYISYVEVVSGYPKNRFGVSVHVEEHIVDGAMTYQVVENGYIKFLDVETGGRVFALAIRKPVAGKSGLASVLRSHGDTTNLTCESLETLP